MEMKDQSPAPDVPLSEEGRATVQEHNAATDAAAESGNGMGEEVLEAATDLTPETLQEQLEQQRRQAEEYLDHLQRLQAEFNNFRRRVTQEKQQAVSRGKEDVLRALLPILANLRLALQHAEEDASAVRQGVQMIWQQFEGFLRDQEVEPIETVGQPFDPAKHEALSTAPATEDTPANTIIAEISAGYLIAGRLLHPAQVVVARAEEPPTAAEPEEMPPGFDAEA